MKINPAYSIEWFPRHHTTHTSVSTVRLTGMFLAVRSRSAMFLNQGKHKKSPSCAIRWIVVGKGDAVSSCVPLLYM